LEPGPIGGMCSPGFIRAVDDMSLRSRSFSEYVRVLGQPDPPGTIPEELAWQIWQTGAFRPTGKPKRLYSWKGSIALVILDAEPQAVRGVVAAVNMRGKSATIMVREKQRPSVGDRFVIHRGQRYLAGARVERVVERRCFCKIILGSVKEGSVVRTGDEAMLVVY